MNDFGGPYVCSIVTAFKLSQKKMSHFLKIMFILEKILKKSKKKIKWYMYIDN